MSIQLKNDLQTEVAEFLSAFIRNAAPTRDNPLLVSTIYNGAQKHGYPSDVVIAVLPEATACYACGFFGDGGVQIRGITGNNLYRGIISKSMARNPYFSIEMLSMINVHKGHFINNSYEIHLQKAWTQICQNT